MQHTFKILLLASLCLLGSQSFGQLGAFQLEIHPDSIGTNYDWYGYPRAVPVNDSVYVVAVGYSDGTFAINTLFIKITENGDTLWTSGVGSTNNTEVPVSLVASMDGGYFLAGTYNVPGTNYDDEVYVAKVDDQGNFLWDDNLTSSGICCWDFSVGKAIQTADSGYACPDMGFGISTGSGTIHKLGQGGNNDWIAGFGSWDRPNRLLETANGDIIGVGWKVTSTRAAITRRVDGNGNNVWYKNWLHPTVDQTLSSSANGIVAVNNGYLVGVNYTDLSGNVNMWLLHLDENGDTITTRNYIDFGQFTDMHLQSDSSLIFIGGAVNTYTQADFKVTHMDQNWNVQGSVMIGTTENDLLGSFEPLSDGGFLLCGIKQPEIWLVKADSNCCVPSTMSFTADTSNLYGAPGLNVSFTPIIEGMVGGAGNIIWDFGDGSVDTAFNPTHSYATSGAYQVCATYITPCDTVVYCDSVHVICEAPIANFTRSDSVMKYFFTSTSINASTWSWTFGDGATSTDSDPEHEYAAAGTYQVCLIVTNPCGTDTFCETLQPFQVDYTLYRYMDAGTSHGMIICDNGELATAGFNSWGAVGDGTTNSTTTYAPIIPSGVWKVATGQNTSFALMDDSTVWSWGNAIYGGLGEDVGATMRTTPDQINTLTDIIDIDAGESHAIALKSDGTVWTWGQGSYGALGHGDWSNDTIPQMVAGLTNIVAVAAGGHSSAVLTADGDVYTWGRNDEGQLAINNTSNKNTPQLLIYNVSGNAAQVVLGHKTLIVLDSLGTAKFAGYNYYGQYGTGSTNDSYVLTPGFGFNDIIAVDMGHRFAMVMRRDRTVWTSGWNNSGELGDGTGTQSTVPVMVMTDGFMLGTGRQSSWVMKTDRSIWGWGWNGGQVGDGTTTNIFSPVQVYSCPCLGPQFSISATDASCFGEANGTAQVTVSSGSGPFSYQWDANAGSQVFETATGLAAGTYTVSVADNTQCPTIDSIVIAEPALIDTALSQSVCPSDSVFVGGAWQTTPGVYTDTLTASNGCDSLQHTTLIHFANNTSSQSFTICPGDSVFAEGAWQLQAGNYSDTLSSMMGCDSVITTSISLIAGLNSNASLTICPNDSAFLGGAYQTVAGNYTDTVLSAAGCDSVVTTALSIGNTSTSSQNISICQGDSIWLQGDYQNTAGTYIDSLATSLGCDSVVTVTLAIDNNSSNTITETACFSYTVPSGNATYTSSGTYSDTLSNILGCDSIIDIQLSINTVDVGVISSPTDLTATATNATFQWYNCDNGFQILTLETSHILIPSSNGQYAVVVTQNGCVDTSSCITVTGVGIDMLSLDQQITLHPNPTGGIFKVSYENVASIQKLQVMNALMQEVLTLNADPTSTTIDLSDYENGVYFVRVICDEGILTKRILIQR